MQIDLIKENPRNPRKIEEVAFRKLVKSIKEFPEMLQARPLIIDENNFVIGGNMRLKALHEAKIDDVPVTQVKWTDEQKRQFVIKDNLAYGIWDYEMLGADYELAELEDWGLDISSMGFDKDTEYPDGEGGSLAKDFLIPPFSVFDTKQGYWQDRKRNWTTYFGDSREGRKDNLLGNSELLMQGNLTGTSEFDPVLAEISYKWWNIPEGKILDPFAGGVVRGAVAGKVGCSYKGIDLSEEQIKTNRAKIEELGEKNVEYIHGNSLDIDTLVKDNDFDLVYSCPPYFDLEVYTDNKSDLSNLGDYDEFIKQYKEIIKKSCAKLKNDRFAIFTVGDIRDKKGNYRCFVQDTIQAFKDAGLSFYNDIVLLNAIATASLRARKLFTNRKVVKVHQNVLVFYKGDPKKIKDNYLMDFDFSEVIKEDTSAELENI